MTPALAALVLFDLDGTLVDSAIDLLNAINVIATGEGEPALPLSTIRPVVSRGARAMLAAAFPERDAAQRELLLQPFLSAYADAVAHHSTAFEGVAEVLERIEANGSRWGIVTNKPHYLAFDIVETMGWTQRCAILIGGDTLPRKKPDPDQLLLACRTLGVEPSHSVYVGDDERDIIAARNAGMKSVAALWGYRQADDDPRAWRADASASMALELLAEGRLRPFQ